MAKLTLFAAALVLGVAIGLAPAQDEEPTPPEAEEPAEVLLDDREASRPKYFAGEEDEAPAADPKDRAAQAQLARTLPEVVFDGVGFTDVVDFLRDVTRADIFVNWRALEAVGIERNAPVNARLRNVKFSKALQIILDGVGGEKVELGYVIDDSVITISTADDLAKHTLTRVHDIRDIVRAKPDAPDAEKGKRLAVLTKLITGSVAPDSWRGQGGSSGALRELQGQLIITQTPENQDAIVNLLKQTRALLALPPLEEPAPVVPDPKDE